MSEYIFEINEALYNEETGEAVMKPEIKGELIRCKDCKHYNPIGVCIEMNCAVCEDSFCCWAERRTDEQS